MNEPVVFDSFEHEPSDDLTFQSEAFDFAHRDMNADTISTIPVLFEAVNNPLTHTLSESWRKKIVVAAGVFYDTNPESPRKAIGIAGNFKQRIPEEEADEHDVEIEKVCAEADLLVRADHAGYTRLGAITVAAFNSPKQIYDILGVHASTLHPCGDCRGMLSVNEMVHRTAIFTTNLGVGPRRYQVQSEASLARRYRALEAGEPFDDPTMQHYTSSDWALKHNFYLQETKRLGIRGTMYDGNIKKEEARRKLAYEVMQKDFIDLNIRN